MIAVITAAAAQVAGAGAKQDPGMPQFNPEFYPSQLFWLAVSFARSDPRNEASVRVQRKLGMRQEAHFVENVFFKGAWGSEFLFAVLEREWAARPRRPVRRQGRRH